MPRGFWMIFAKWLILQWQIGQICVSEDWYRTHIGVLYDERVIQEMEQQKMAIERLSEFLWRQMKGEDFR